MNEEFLDYYYRELAFLREMGAEFAAAYPQIARQLQLEEGRVADPHVERLLEAFAFLTARVRRKIDDEYPEISDALLSVLYPDYQRPIPSMAIVQFLAAADPSKIAAGVTIPRGTELVSRAVRDVPCRFRTAQATTLWPIAVDEAEIKPDRLTRADRPPRATALLRLKLRCAAPAGWASLERFDSLRFFLEGAEPLPSSIYEALFNQLCGVWIQGKNAANELRTIPLPLEAVRPVGFAEGEALLPSSTRSFPGYRLLQEFLAFPSKFLFFDLGGLARIRAESFVGPVEVLFFLENPPRSEVAVRPTNFLLGCSPIVNLFELASEPIRLSQFRTEYRVIPVINQPLSYEVFSVDRVISTGSFIEGTTEFHPFYAMRHGSRGSDGAFWIAHRTPSLRAQDDGTEVDLAFTDPSFHPHTPAVETVTAFVTCSNRDLPVELPYGGDQGELAIESDAPVSRVRLLTKPSPTLRPPLGRSSQWRLISQLGLGHLSLIETDQGPEPLRELLALFDFTESAALRKQFAGILSVSSRRVAARIGDNRIRGKTVSLGVQISLHFDEEAFAGNSAYLLASVLERFFGAYVSINSFTQLVATSKQREGVWKRWPPRCGDRTLL